MWSSKLNISDLSKASDDEGATSHKSAVTEKPLQASRGDIPQGVII